MKFVLKNITPIFLGFQVFIHNETVRVAPNQNPTTKPNKQAHLCCCVVKLGLGTDPQDTALTALQTPACAVYRKNKLSCLSFPFLCLLLTLFNTGCQLLYKYPPHPNVSSVPQLHHFGGKLSKEISKGGCAQRKSYIELRR